MTNPVSPCPACGGRSAEVFYETRALPVHATQVCTTPEQAKQLPRGNQRLAVCLGCGLVYNTIFEPRRLAYGGDHEESQSFSPTFRRFASQLAADWVDRWALAGRTVVEVGCGGRGEFLSLLAEAGVGLAFGVDPGLKAEHLPARRDVAGDRSVARRSEASLAAAAVVCRHTLEHIPDVAAFMTGVLDTVDTERCRVFLFEVPDFDRVLDEGTFWDLHYEHCSSFTAFALHALFSRLGFDVLNLRRVYGDQYLVIEADPVRGRSEAGPLIEIGSIDRHVAKCRQFARLTAERCQAVEDILGRMEREGREIVVWGGGAKGSVLMSSVESTAVRRVVDINPGLQGHYLPGSGLPIVSPASLQDDPPAAVLLMNPMYTGEVRQMLDRLELTSVEIFPA